MKTRYIVEGIDSCGHFISRGADGLAEIKKMIVSTYSPIFNAVIYKITNGEKMKGI